MMRPGRPPEADRLLAEAAASGDTILAPNTELAAALLDAVERRHVAAGEQVWSTPRIRDLGSHLREVYAAACGEDDGLPRVLSDVEERELWRDVVLDSDAAIRFLAPDGAPQSARRARRAMAEYGIPAQALAGHATEESLALLRWGRDFDARCRELECMAADGLLTAITRLPDARREPRVRWIESPAWRPMARRWLEQRHAAPLLPAHRVAAREPARCKALSPDLELAAIAAWAEANLRAMSEFRAWICVPDLASRRAQLDDAFDAVLAPRRFAAGDDAQRAQYAVAGGTPLADHSPIAAALETLAATFGRLPFEEFSALLRSPELQASPAEAGGAARLDLALRAGAPDEAAFADWLELALAAAGPTGVPAALERLVRFHRIVAQVRGRQPFSRWVALWVQAFEAGPWAHRQSWSSAQFQAAERFRELLASLATAASLGVRSHESAAAVLGRAARDTPFQPQTGIPPIWVSAQPTDPWLPVEGLWVAGCSDERWPPPPDPHPLLPVGVQREFGVVAAGADLQLLFAVDLQRRWLARGGQCVFSCADPEDGRHAAFSPIVPHGEALMSEAGVRPHWSALAARAPPLEQLQDEAAPPFGARERTLGVATLRAQSQCAFRGFAHTRLAARPLELPAAGFDARERGNMLHHALEHIWSALGSSERLRATPPDERRVLIRDGVERAIARQCRRRDPGARWRGREAARLAALLDTWLDTELEREPFEVAGIEAASDAAFGGIDYRVRIDRIDRLADGGIVLIDYKTGTPAVDWRGDRPENPQLPVYALLRPSRLAAVAYARVNAADCGFVAEAARDGIFRRGARKTALEELPDFAALVALWSRRIEKIAAEFAAGDAAVAPTLRACASCDLHALCRVPAAAEQGGGPEQGDGSGQGGGAQRRDGSERGDGSQHGGDDG